MVFKRNHGFVKFCTQHRRVGHSKQGFSLADSFLEMSNRDANYSILQFTDLHYYNNGSREDKEGIQLIGAVAERVKPNLVVLTGDIIDGRYCKDYRCFRNVVQPLIDLGIPWTYVPGNHDDETKKFTRKDLLNVYKLPLCASSNATTFTHTIKLGPMQIYLIDSHGYEDNTAEVLSYDFIKQNQIDWYKITKSEGEVGLAFFHIPLQEYKKSKVLIGTRGEEPCTPQYNSGFFKAIKKKRDIHALFTGHDHWNDFVSELNGIWLAYGRVSGFTTSCFYGEGATPIKKERGGRVIRYDSSRKILSTWVENKKGVEHNTLISKSISIEKASVVDDQ